MLEKTLNLEVILVEKARTRMTYMCARRVKARSALCGCSNVEGVIPIILTQVEYLCSEVGIWTHVDAVMVEIAKMAAARSPE